MYSICCSARQEETERLEQERAAAREAMTAERQAMKKSLEATRQVVGGQE